MKNCPVKNCHLSNQLRVVIYSMLAVMIYEAAIIFYMQNNNQCYQHKVHGMVVPRFAKYVGFI